VEEAQYTQTIIGRDELVNFLKRRGPKLIESKIMTEETATILREVVKKSEIVAACHSIESERFTQREHLQWKSGCSVAVEMRGLIPEDLLAKTSQILALQESQKETTKQIASLEEHIKKVFTNQSRLRENIKSLEKVSSSELVKRYLTDLNREEDDLIKTRSLIEAQESQKHKIEATLKNLNFEASGMARKLREAADQKRIGDHEGEKKQKKK